MSDKRIRPADPSETQATADLIARVFARDPSYLRLTGWYRWMLRNPDHRPEYVRVVELEGRIVSHLLVVERRIQLRNGVVRAAGLSVVATLQEYQRRGLNSELILETLDFARAEGFHISLLDGIPDYYGRYGYQAVMPKYEARVPTRKGRELPSNLEVRELPLDEARGRIRELAALYEEETSELIGAAVRSHDYWAWLLERGGPILMCGAEGRLLAYAWLGDDEDQVRVEEAGGRNPAAVSAVLKAVAEHAAERVQPEIVLYLHPNSPFARTLTLLTEAEFRTTFRPNAGWMGLVLDAEAVARAALPSEWPARSSGDLVLRVDDAVLRIRATDRGPVVETLGPDRARQREPDAEVGRDGLVQLAFGYASAAGLASLGRLKASPDVIGILSQLFPPAQPGLSVKDHF